MKSWILIGLISCLITLSCSNKKEKANDSEKDSTPDIINKIAELPEYKREERKIDSLKGKGINVDIQIMVLPDKVNPEDSLATAFIEENYGFDQEQVYEIKFEKVTHKIISVFLKSNPEPFKDEKIKKVN